MNLSPFSSYPRSNVLCIESALIKLFDGSDDLTVEVIFFGEGERTGTVLQNTEASAPNQRPKAKL